MILRKELQQLATALKSAKEYTDMASLRKSIMNSPGLSKLMANFEREHSRLISLNLSDADAAARFKKLYSDYEGFLEKQEIKNYIKATQAYHNMIAENISYLNSLLDITK